MMMKLHRMFIFIFLALLAGSASGMSLAEYQKAVEEAHGHAYDIITEINDGGEETRNTMTSASRDASAIARRA